MKRAGAKGSGKFQRISWDEAIDTIASKIAEVKEKYGPYTIGNLAMAGVMNFPLASWLGAGCTGWSGCSTAGVAEPELWVMGRPQARKDRQHEETC